ncbi:unnamed protein product [Urochloa decumbens]|uniref:F-box domain-containing protein n=1 Tax=Urochloa decumbens TaxID=240449 RepID=A0ABC9F183_9POAL
METPAAGDDRLSELPDCLLTDNVLSRLTSLQAARTSTLSRRWRHLWRAVPCVDIDQREFRASEAIDARAAEDIVAATNEKIRLSVEESEAFEDLCERLLPLIDATPPPLDTLRLRFSCTDFRSIGRRLARRGLARRPVEFHLSCDNDDVPKTMRLAGLGLADDLFADCIAKDFPVLEDLRLEGCKYRFRRLTSQSLRKLSIDRCRRVYMPNDALAVAAPCIASLHINGDPPPVAVVGEMPGLVAASLREPTGELGFLRSLRHARSLDLTGFSATVLIGGDDTENFPVFGNLRTLLLYRCDVGVECQVLRRFLWNAPSLETLTLRYCSCSGGSSSSKKRKARSGERTSSSDWCIRTAYACMKNLKSIELEFCEGHAVDELAQALVGISKEEARQM